MRKAKLWITVAASGALALALATAAIGADLTSTDATGPGTLPDRASAVATAVIAAVTGGSNPASIASSGKSNASSEHATTTTTAEDETATEATETEDNDTGQAADTGPKPGWGCGDTNHTHTGPSGNPNATSPCDKSH